MLPLLLLHYILPFIQIFSFRFFIFFFPFSFKEIHPCAIHSLALYNSCINVWLKKKGKYNFVFHNGKKYLHFFLVALALTSSLEFSFFFFRSLHCNVIYKLPFPCCYLLLNSTTMWYLTFFPAPHNRLPFLFFFSSRVSVRETLWQ